MKEVVESRHLRHRSAVFCGVRDHSEAERNQCSRVDEQARLLPNGVVRRTGMWHAGLVATLGAIGGR